MRGPSIGKVSNVIKIDANAYAEMRVARRMRVSRVKSDAQSLLSMLALLLGADIRVAGA
jgi:hypothetical protein